MVVVSRARVVSTVQGVGVPVTIQSLDPAQSLPSVLTSVVQSTVFQDGFSGSGGLGRVGGGMELVVGVVDYFSFSWWCCTGRGRQGRGPSFQL